MQESYLDDVVRHALVLISTKHHQQRCASMSELLLQQESLDPEEVVLVFRQFFILDTLTYHGDQILLLLHRKYFDEFRSATRSSKKLGVEACSLDILPLITLRAS